MAVFLLGQHNSDKGKIKKGKTPLKTKKSRVTLCYEFYSISKARLGKNKDDYWVSVQQGTEEV